MYRKSIFAVISQGDGLSPVRVCALTLYNTSDSMVTSSTSWILSMSSKLVLSKMMSPLYIKSITCEWNGMNIFCWNLKTSWERGRWVFDNGLIKHSGGTFSATWELSPLSNSTSWHVSPSSAPGSSTEYGKISWTQNNYWHGEYPTL